MKPVISDAIRYVGVDDDTLDIFESQYILENGVSYNSYVILDEKIAIMDTVDKRCTDEWLANVEETLGGSKPDYIVVHHMEPDHSGSLADALEKYPDAVVVASAKAFTFMDQFLSNTEGLKKLVVKDGDTLSLGSHTLSFIAAPMVHWPEVMMSYESLEKVVFSADGFGKFGTLKTDEDWACEARRYYFNIVGKYGASVQAVLKKINDNDLDIEKILPLHGPILDSDISYYMGLYDVWSRYEPESKGVFIACASIHGNTAHAANVLAEKIKALGEERVVVADLSREDIAECVEDAFRHDRMILASASYDAGAFMPMEDFLHHLVRKTYQNRTVGLLENGTWAPSALKTMKGYLEEMKNIRILDETVSIKSTYKPADEDAMDALAKAIFEAGRT